MKEDNTISYPLFVHAIRENIYGLGSYHTRRKLYLAVCKLVTYAYFVVAGHIFLGQLWGALFNGAKSKLSVAFETIKSKL